VQSSDNSVFYSDGTTIYVYGVDVGYPIHGSQGISSGGANLFSGNVVKSVVDAELPGIPLSFKFARTYNSFSDANIGLGKGWTHNYNICLLKVGDNNIILMRGDGKKVIYRLTDGVYTPLVPWEHATLSGSLSGGFTLTEKNGLKYYFNGFVDNSNPNYTANGKIYRIVDRNGNALTFTYNDEGLLSTITDQLSRTVNFTYNDNELLTSMSLPGNVTINYSYLNSNLVSVIGPGNITSTYNYDMTNGTSGMLINYSEPRLEAGDRNKSYTYYIGGIDDNKVKSVSNGNGVIIENYSYDDTNLTTTKTDGNGNSYVQYYDDQGRVIKTAEPISGTVLYSWDDHFNKKSITDELGNVTAYGYDNLDNLKTKTDAAGRGNLAMVSVKQG
jgi:YD repeat-containing protein